MYVRTALLPGCNNLANELPNVLPDDIPTSSSSGDNISKLSVLNGYPFNSTTEGEVYELILQLDPSKGLETDGDLDIKSLKSIIVFKYKETIVKETRNSRKQEIEFSFLYTLYIHN